MNTVGNRIRKYRKDNSLTQDQLAEKLNVTHQAVSSWETGKTQPDIQTLKQLADLFEVSVEDLIYEEKRSPVQTVVNSDSAKSGVRLGMVLAVVISYVKWNSVGWAIFHGLLGWVYVVYYLLRY